MFRRADSEQLGKEAEQLKLEVSEMSVAAVFRGMEWRCVHERGVIVESIMVGDEGGHSEFVCQEQRKEVCGRLSLRRGERKPYARRSARSCVRDMPRKGLRNVLKSKMIIVEYSI